MQTNILWAAGVAAFILLRNRISDAKEEAFRAQATRNVHERLSYAVDRWVYDYDDVQHQIEVEIGNLAVKAAAKTGSRLRSVL